MGCLSNDTLHGHDRLQVQPSHAACILAILKMLVASHHWTPASAPPSAANKSCWPKVAARKSPAFPAAGEVPWRCVGPVRPAFAEHCSKCHQDDNMMDGTYCIYFHQKSVERLLLLYAGEAGHGCGELLVGGSYFISADQVEAGAGLPRRGCARTHARTHAAQTSDNLRSPGGLLTKRTPGPPTLLSWAVASFMRAQWDERSGTSGVAQNFGTRPKGASRSSDYPQILTTSWWASCLLLHLWNWLLPSSCIIYSCELSRFRLIKSTECSFPSRPFSQIENSRRMVIFIVSSPRQRRHLWRIP